jgi:hypothetical protein
MINRMQGGATLRHPEAAEARPRAATTVHGLGTVFRRAEAAIVDHPRASLCAALAAGALLGWFIKRR